MNVQLQFLIFKIDDPNDVDFYALSCTLHISKMQKKTHLKALEIPFLALMKPYENEQHNEKGQPSQRSINENH